MFVLAALVSALFATRTLAHGGVTSYTIAGSKYVGWQPYNSPTGQSSIERPYSSYDPILDPAASTIHCNNNGQASASQLTATVAAGSTVTAYWTQWTHAQGPVMVYMASCGSSCTSVNTASLKWFKIAQTGLISGTLANGTWGTGLVMSTLKYDAVIPAALAPGQYMIRHELLALHQANTPQFYPECAQLSVTGSGTKTPASSYLVSLPGAYSMSSPGVNINIYTAEAQTITSYTVPGPAVWTGA